MEIGRYEFISDVHPFLLYKGMTLDVFRRSGNAPCWNESLIRKRSNDFIMLMQRDIKKAGTSSMPEHLLDPKLLLALISSFSVQGERKKDFG
jgi:hypothetical protein